MILICRLYFFYRLLIVTGLVFIIDAQHYLYSSALPLNNEISLLKQSLVPLNKVQNSLAVINLIGQKRYVLIGDSTHGSEEFYQQRIDLSKQLIEYKNFKLVVLEADLLNVEQLNQYVHSSIPESASELLNVSNPEGAWIWNNKPMLDFLHWLKQYNTRFADVSQKVSLHGMDIYSFARSRQAVVDYLQPFSLPAARQALQRYQCFSQFKNLHQYGQQVTEEPSISCESAVTEQFLDFDLCRFPCPEKNSFIEQDAFFYARENARLVKHTEKNFRVLYQTANDIESWNIRDQYMMASIRAISAHLKQPKTIIWAHNSHLGDARATQVAEQSQLNLGQLMRQHFKQEVFSLGMITYTGEVLAADEWQSPVKIKTLLNAHPESVAALFHSLGISHFLLNLQQSEPLRQFLNKTRLQRHVGVIYQPQDELNSHYNRTHLADEFDAIIFIDRTSPIHLLGKGFWD